MGSISQWASDYPNFYVKTETEPITEKSSLSFCIFGKLGDKAKTCFHRKLHVHHFEVILDMWIFYAQKIGSRN